MRSTGANGDLRTALYWMVCVVHRSRSTMAVGIEQILHDRGRCNLAGADRRMAWRAMTVTAALKGHLLLSFEVVSFNTLMDSCTPSTRERCHRWQLTCTLFMDLAVRRLVGTVMSFLEAKGGAFAEATPTQVGTLIQPEYLDSLGIFRWLVSREQHVCMKSVVLTKVLVLSLLHLGGMLEQGNGSML